MLAIIVSHSQGALLYETILSLPLHGDLGKSFSHWSAIQFVDMSISKSSPRGQCNGVERSLFTWNAEHLVHI